MAFEKKKIIRLLSLGAAISALFIGWNLGLKKDTIMHTKNQNQERRFHYEVSKASYPKTYEFLKSLFVKGPRSGKFPMERDASKTGSYELDPEREIFHFDLAFRSVKTDQEKGFTLSSPLRSLEELSQMEFWKAFLPRLRGKEFQVLVKEADADRFSIHFSPDAGRFSIILKMNAEPYDPNDDMDLLI